MKVGVFIEMGPLLELAYTGIANLTAALSSYWLTREDVDVHFFHEHVVIDPAEISRAIELKCGAVMRCQIANGCAIKGYIEQVTSRYDKTAAIFCNVKTVQKQFDLEYQIIYDLTFLITPEFHHNDTILYHGLTLLRDIERNKETFCISECTKEDLVLYSGISADRVSVHYPAPSISQESSHIGNAGFEACEKYILVIGTIEPRKNADLILRFVSKKRSVLDKYRLVFIGRAGWLINFESSLTGYDLIDAFKSNQIIWLDFVSDGERDLLYKGASAVFYPSIYEGFGLPLVEAMSFGCPVLASFSSSMPEVGGDAAIYFDPMSLDSFEAAFARFERCNKAQLAHSSKEQAARFSWDQFNSGIADVVLRDLSA